MVKLRKLQTDLERLKKRYEALLRDAALIATINPTRSTEKVQESRQILRKIKELEIAQYN